MADKSPQLGFSYFTEPEYLLAQHLHIWMPMLHKWGGKYVVLQANFDLAIPEDVFISAQNSGLEPFVHFNVHLPSARAFNDASAMIDIYKKWGVKNIILGDKPNVKNAWPIASWHFETLVDKYLDRFIPLANHAVRIGLNPILAPLLPGGDYWDCAFLELLLEGLKQRQMDQLIERLTLASYGYTFHRPLLWGEGGPERWSGCKPYQTPEGHQDQIGFNNYEWVQASSQRIIGKRLPVLILDAGRPSPSLESVVDNGAINSIQNLVNAYRMPQTLNPDLLSEVPALNDLVMGCTFGLDTFRSLLGDEFSIESLKKVFFGDSFIKVKAVPGSGDVKYLKHYLLLPSYASGVPDVILNKVRPLIKKYQPTVGFSMDEAAFAAKVSVFPDPFLFPDEIINQLRAAGCQVEILPDSGIEIATQIQESLVE
ncbi:MAG: hypothetical protein K0B06_00840 [Brevefilum sp.]|nr:hypothetical protein [Brevefilum sp.]